MCPACGTIAALPCAGCSGWKRRWPAIERAAALAPTHVNALTNRAIALFDLRRLEEALAASEAALDGAGRLRRSALCQGQYPARSGPAWPRRWPATSRPWRKARASRPGPERRWRRRRGAVRLGQGRGADAAPETAMSLAAAALIQPFVLMGYSDDAALLQRRCAENYVRRIVPPARAACPTQALPHTTAFGWPICRPISISIPPPS